MEKELVRQSKLSLPESLTKELTALRGVMLKALPASFYEQKTLVVAKKLIGKIVCRRNGDRWIGGRIVETEAYWGTDPASHSAKGQTPRSAPMFEEAGRTYIYFIYGMYDMLNFVTEPKGKPGAVLIRGIVPLIGLDLIQKNRAGVVCRDWTNGPGRLTQAMGITREDNRQSLLGPNYFVLEDSFRVSKIKKGPRIGISKAVDKNYRFCLEGIE